MGKIPTYPPLTDPTDNDLLIIEDMTSSSTKKITRGDFLNDIKFADLLSTIFSGEVTSAANVGTAGGTNYYINLGGIKLLWGSSSGVNAGTGGSFTVTLPAFFTTIQATLFSTSSSLGSAGGTNAASIGAGSASTTSTLNIHVHVSAGGSTNTPLSWLVIGT